MKNTVIKVSNVSKIYENSKEKVIALTGINFSLQEGEDLAILGPSGSGKTTLLQILGGLSRASTGEVVIDGQKTTELSEKELSNLRNKKIGFIFQNIYLQEYLTARENVMVPMLISKIKFKEASKRAVELLESVGLKDRINFPPSRLSGGEEQRVAVARAIAMNPKILFADEPTAKLDEKNTEKILGILKKINSEGVSLVVITHDSKVAANFSKQINIEHGKITKTNLF